MWIDILWEREKARLDMVGEERRERRNHTQKYMEKRN